MASQLNLAKIKNILRELECQISNLSEDPCVCYEELPKFSGTVRKLDQETTVLFERINEILTERYKKNPYANALCRNCSLRTLDSNGCCTVCGWGTVDKIINEIIGQIENS